MDQTSQTSTITVDFPGDLEYIPDIRRLISNVISLRGFSRRFTFRMEIIIDELCSNAVKFGRMKIGEFVSVKADVSDLDVAIHVSHPGVDEDNILRLKHAISDAGLSQSDGVVLPISDSRGMQIVKILCDKISIDTTKGTTVAVHKKSTPNDDL